MLQTVSKLYLQCVWGVWSLLWVLGHQVQVSWSVALENKKVQHTLTHSHRLYYHPRWPRQTRERLYDCVGVVEWTNWRRGGEKKGEDDAWKKKKEEHHQDSSDYNNNNNNNKEKKNQCPIFLLYLVSFSPAWPFTAGEGGEEWDEARRRVGKGRREKWLTSSRTANAWQVRALAWYCGRTHLRRIIL